MSDLHQTLQDLHRELADARQLDPGDRALLEAAVGEIQRALGADPAPATDTPLAPADTLEGAAVRLEAGHPGLAGALRALADALAKAGI
jgi:Domain of unknown function (DUF4404)